MPGDLIEIANDPPEKATAVYARPCSPQDFEVRFIPEADRTSKRYGGYALVLSLENIGQYCELIHSSN